MTRLNWNPDRFNSKKFRREKRAEGRRYASKPIRLNVPKASGRHQPIGSQRSTHPAILAGLYASLKNIFVRKGR